MLRETGCETAGLNYVCYRGLCILNPDQIVHDIKHSSIRVNITLTSTANIFCFSLHVGKVGQPCYTTGNLFKEQQFYEVGPHKQEVTVFSNVKTTDKQSGDNISGNFMFHSYVERTNRGDTNKCHGYTVPQANTGGKDEIDIFKTEGGLLVSEAWCCPCERLVRLCAEHSNKDKVK